MAATNRTCAICGVKYRYCPTCDEDRKKPTWMTMYCGERCKQLNDILIANTFGRKTDAETADELRTNGFDDPDISRVPTVASRIAQLIAKNKPVPKKKEVPEKQGPDENEDNDTEAAVETIEEEDV